MIERTPLQTERLILRCYVPGDGDAVWPVVSHAKVYATTYNIPKEYPREHVDWWFAHLRDAWEKDGAYEFGLFHKDDGAYIGNCGLISIDRRNDAGTIAYMADPARWGQGYMTEAARAVCAFGFDTLSLNRINGECFSSNPASRRVMEKVGFQYEGTRRQLHKKDDKYIDIDQLGLLREEFSHS